jgi:hypothetical protein
MASSTAQASAPAVLKESIAGLYDESSGVWESIWGDHMHHGFCDSGEAASMADHRRAQIRMIEEALAFAAVPSGAYLPDPSAPSPTLLRGALEAGLSAIRFPMLVGTSCEPSRPPVFLAIKKWHTARGLPPVCCLICSVSQLRATSKLMIGKSEAPPHPAVPCRILNHMVLLQYKPPYKAAQVLLYTVHVP